MSCIPIQDFSLITLCDATKAGKLYSIVPDTGAGDFDVTRASTATYLGSDGLLKTAATNEPRIEFNPDGSYKGLLVEPAATNLALRSEEFDNAYWTKVNVTITPNVEVAPDGTMTADRVVTQGDSADRLERSFSVSQNTFFTLSLFVKANGPTDNRIRLNLQFVGGTFTENFVTVEATNEWVRYTATLNSGDNTTLNLRVVRGASEVGDVFIWGAQLETGPVATSYIPTVASTVTRAADVITRTGASALIGQSEGTVYMEVDIQKSVLGTVAFIDIGNSNGFIGITKNTNRSITVNIRASGGSFPAIITSPILSIGMHKIALGYKNGDYALYIDGVSAGTSTNSTDYPVGTLSRFCLSEPAYGFFNDHIKAAALLPTRLSNAQLQSLTS